jgi:hypothetical protein
MNTMVRTCLMMVRLGMLNHQRQDPLGDVFVSEASLYLWNQSWDGQQAKQ